MTDRTQHQSKTRALFLTVKEVARAAGVEAHVVRFHARAGLIRPARLAVNVYRHFAGLDVKRVRFVRVAQSLGFTLADIHEIFRRSRQHTTPCPLVRDTIVQRLREHREHLNRVLALQERMDSASERWRHLPDSVPDGESICALIEAVADDAPPPPAKTQHLAKAHLRRRA